jgi:selenide,water dikinase
MEVGASAGTDVTGFGLLGHAAHIARASELTLRFQLERLSVIPWAREAWHAGATPGGAERNESWLAELTAWGEPEPFLRALVLDPQTSGGLLLALPAERVADYLQRVPAAVEVGDVMARGDRLIVLA